MIPTPVVLSVYDREGEPYGWIRAARSVTVTPRWWATGTIKVALPGTSPLVPILRTPGARMLATYGQRHEVGGMVTAYDATVSAQQAMWTFDVDDDRTILSQVLARKDHTKALAAQPATGVTYAGKTETVVKNVVAGSLAHAGYLIDVEPDAGRGINTSITPDMLNLHETTLDALKAAGGEVTVTWRPETGRYLIGYREGVEYPPILSVDDRSVAQVVVSKAAPIVTRVVVSDGAATPAYTAAENSPQQAAYRVAETLRSGSTATERAEAANDAANEGAEKTGLAVTFNADPGHHYGPGGGMRVGDMITVRIGDALVTDRLIEAPIVHEPGMGLRITPNVGGWSNHPSRRLVAAIDRLDARMRGLTGR